MKSEGSQDATPAETAQVQDGAEAEAVQVTMRWTKLSCALTIIWFGTVMALSFWVWSFLTRSQDRLDSLENSLQNADIQVIDVEASHRKLQAQVEKLYEEVSAISAPALRTRFNAPIEAVIGRPLRVVGHNVESIKLEAKGQFLVEFEKPMPTAYMTLVSSTGGYASITRNKPESVTILSFDTNGKPNSVAEFSILIYVLQSND